MDTSSQRSNRKEAAHEASKGAPRKDPSSPTSVKMGGSLSVNGDRTKASTSFPSDGQRAVAALSAFEDPLTISGVFDILGIRLSKENLQELLEDFTDDRHGVEELVAHLRGDPDEPLTSYNLTGAKTELRKFCEWFDTWYKPADDSSKPEFSREMWAAYQASPYPPKGRSAAKGWRVARLPLSSFEAGNEDVVSLLPEGPGDADDEIEYKPQDLSSLPVAFPGASRVRLLLDRYNQNVGQFLPSLRVDWADVEKMYERLKVLCPRGLVDSLVYSPRDLSVFVRREDAFRYIVDVALCTQDRTHRSNVRLDGDIANRCDNRVGKIEDRMKAPAIECLHPIVRDFVEQRILETISCPTEKLCTIELAPTYNETRMDVSNEVAASALWGDYGHQRPKFDFDRSSDDQDLFGSWLICMTLFERKTTEAEQEAIRQYLLNRYADFEGRVMTENVNYETMFRSKGPRYRSGRLSWPLILGLCMAKNLKEELEPFQGADAELQSRLGTYCGLFTDAHFLCGGLAVALSCSLFIVAAFAVTTWDVALLRLLATLVVPSVLMVVTANFYFLRDPRPLAFLVANDRSPPRLTEKDRDLAIRLLLNESCRRHFDGMNLSFTGETYKGTAMFGYRFTYKDLRELGFGFYCDSWGREHLRVPKTGALVRMEGSCGVDVDYFVRVPKKDEPELLFEKPWYSRTTFPG